MRIDVLVPVGDVAMACRFYVDVVGLTCQSADKDFATLKAGDSVLWLHREEDGLVQVEGVELWMAVESVDAVHARMVAAGSPGLRPPGDVVAWGLRVASALDPDGRRVFVTQPTSA